MKNIKNTLKGIKADFVAFTKDKEKVKGVITTATLIGLGAVAMNEHNKRTFKKKEKDIHSFGYGEGIAQGMGYAITNMADNNDVEYRKANEAFDRIDDNIQHMLRRNDESLKGYTSMLDTIAEED